MKNLYEFMTPPSQKKPQQIGIYSNQRNLKIVILTVRLFPQNSEEKKLKFCFSGKSLVSREKIFELGEKLDSESLCEFYKT